MSKTEAEGAIARPLTEDADKSNASEGVAAQRVPCAVCGRPYCTTLGNRPGLDSEWEEHWQLGYQRMRAARDSAYTERNRVVAALASIVRLLNWRSGVALHEDKQDEKWDEDWRTIVYIDLPTGQVSWHFHDSEVALLSGLPAYDEPWDGHTTEEKYRRLAGVRDGDAPQAPSDLLSEIKSLRSWRREAEGLLATFDAESRKKLRTAYPTLFQGTEGK